MENDDKLKEIGIKSRTCYYFDDMAKIDDFGHDNILVDEKSYDNILVYNISYKNLIASKPLGIRFDKIDGFIRFYYGIRYLVLFQSKKYNFIYNWIKYVLSVKSCITYVISHNYEKSK